MRKLDHKLSTDKIVLPMKVPATVKLCTLVGGSRPVLGSTVCVKADIVRTIKVACTTGRVVNHSQPFMGCPSGVRTCKTPSTSDPSFPSKRATTTFSLTASLSVACPG